MNSRISDEETIFPSSNDESTQFQSATNRDRLQQTSADSNKRATPPPYRGGSTQSKSETNSKSHVKVGQNKKNGFDWKRAGVAAAGGIVLGAVTPMLMGMVDAENAASPVSGSNPAWADGDVRIASSVNDSMTFDEAFAAARAEVGPGGAFEWHGGVYGTYTAAEWANMSAAERAEFGDHFSWNHYDHSVVNDHHVAAHNSHPTQASIDVDPSNPMDPDESVVEVDPDDVEPIEGEGPFLAVNDQSEIQILGVTQLDSGEIVGSLSVDGQEVVVIDVDGDMQFDVLGVDVNGDGMLDQNEIADISDQDLNVRDLTGGDLAVSGFGENDLYIEDPDNDLRISYENEFLEGELNADMEIHSIPEDPGFPEDMLADNMNLHNDMGQDFSADFVDDGLYDS